jgi:curved DNA-binding protein
VHFRPHPRFHASTAALLVDLPVAPWEAALGAVIPVALPDGSTLKVRVPAGAQSGRNWRARPGLPRQPAGRPRTDRAGRAATGTTRAAQRNCTRRWRAT